MDVGIGLGNTNAFLRMSEMSRNYPEGDQDRHQEDRMSLTNLTMFLWLNSASNFNSRMSISLSGSLNSDIATFRFLHLPT